MGKGGCKMKKYLIGYAVGLFAGAFISNLLTKDRDYQVELTNDQGDYILYDGSRIVGKGNSFENPCIDSLIKNDNQ